MREMKKNREKKKLELQALMAKTVRNWS